MNITEIYTWTCSAPRHQVEAVQVEATGARVLWLKRIHDPCEIYDVGPWARGGRVSIDLAIAAAAEVTLELAIIQTVWPQTPNALHA